MMCGCSLTRKMFFKVLFLCILSCVHGFSECMPKECLKCSMSDVTDTCNKTCSMTCPNASTVDKSCTRGFNVSINGTGSEVSKVEEAAQLSLTCVHDLPAHLNVTYEWMKGKETLKGQNECEYIIEKTFHSKGGQYFCVVHSDCGNFTSAPHGVTVHNDSLIILIVCGCGAVALVVIMGASMKFKMHRDQVKNQLRNKQRLQEMRRAQELQCPHPAPNLSPT